MGTCNLHVIRNPYIERCNDINTYMYVNMCSYVYIYTYMNTSRISIYIYLSCVIRNPIIRNSCDD